MKPQPSKTMATSSRRTSMRQCRNYTFLTRCGAHRPFSSTSSLHRFRCQFGCRFVFPDGHLVIVLLQADCGFWVCAVVVGSAGHEIDLTGSEGLDGTKVGIIKPLVDRFVFPVAHDVIVPAGRPSSKFGLRHWPSVFRDLVFLHGQVLAQLDY